MAVGYQVLGSESDVKAALMEVKRICTFPHNLKTDMTIGYLYD